MLNIISKLPVEKVGEMQLGLNSGNVAAIVPQATAINLLKYRTFKSLGVFDNPLNLFSISSDVVTGEVKFMNFKPKPFGLRPRGNGCSFNPTLGVVSNTEAIKLYGMDGHLAQCADEFMGSCFRQLLGKGVDVYDMLATPEAQRIFAESIATIYAGVAEDINATMWYGRHPLITTAYNAGNTGADADTLQRAYEQLGSNKVTAGYLTIADGLKGKGVPAYNVMINPVTDVNGSTYIGDAKGLFKATKLAASSKMRRAVAASPVNGVFLVQRSIFERYKDQLSGVNGCCTDAGWHLGQNGAESLMYDGHPVIPVDFWDTLDELTNTTSFRVLFVEAGNLGVGYDLPTLRSYGDISMIIERSSAVKDLGKVYGLTALDFGVGLIDADHAAYAALTIAN